jgi:hypothetical protein
VKPHEFLIVQKQGLNYKRKKSDLFLVSLYDKNTYFYQSKFYVSVTHKKERAHHFIPSKFMKFLTKVIEETIFWFSGSFV